MIYILKYKDKDWLYDQYITQKKSAPEIANICNCEKTAILRWLEKFKIKRRSPSEAIKIAMNKPEVKKKLSKAMKARRIIGEKHHRWDENPNYFAIHKWVNRHKTKSEVCEICNKKFDKNGKDKLELSNIDHRYTRNLEDYQYVHPICHANYDKEKKLRKNIIKKVM